MTSITCLLLTIAERCVLLLQLIAIEARALRSQFRLHLALLVSDIV